MPNQFVFPSSFGQKRLWFLDQLVPGHSFYNIHTAVPVSFPVDPGVLQRTVQEIARRHETLRTSFCQEHGEVTQVVHEEVLISVPVHDLTNQPTSQREQELMRLLAEQAHTPFDLGQAPLFRTALIQTEPGHYLFAVTIHHIVADAWSMGVFFRELGEIYRAFAQNRPSPLPELEVQYADFSVWQGEYLRGEVLRQDLEFWRKTLAGAEVLNLPTDRPRPPVPSFRGASHQFVLPAPLIARLHRVTRQENCTLFMVLLAAYKILLYRYTAQTDLVIGIPVANRNMTQLEPLIGFFVNTVVLRTDLSGEPTALETVRRIRDAAVSAYAHQNLPFEKLVDDLRPERDLSRNPLFQLTFQLHNEPGLRAAERADSARPTAVASRGTSNFDIAFDLWQEGDSIVAQLDYATDLFEPDTIRRMGRHYQQILHALAENGERRISELPMLTPAEMDQVLHVWNATTRAYPAESCIHTLFEDVARSTPGKEALRFQGRSLTYAELNRRADEVARVLRRFGVGPEVPVAICMDRCMEMVIGLLGILKAGGPYIGIDPRQPLVRVQQIVEDAGCRCIVSTTAHGQLLGALGKEQVILDRVEAPVVNAVGTPAQEADWPMPKAQNAAYICYTSGSTGQPKGVIITHRNVVRLVRNTNYIDIHPEDVFMLFAPLSFDASTFEIWGALLNGATLVVYPPETPSLSALGEFIQREQISTAFLTAGLFHQMVDAEVEKLAGVHWLLSGGDVVSPRHVRRALEYPGRRVLINAYGPTEAATFATCHVMTHPDRVEAPLPIGRPVSNSRVYLLDGAMNPVPVGVAAELFIGGDGVGRGYLKRSELTDRCFVPDPFSTKEGARLYRTGDLARWRADGSIEFLRRIDRQVKIRGYRVELGEIEAALRRCPQVREAIVRAVDTPDGKLVAAYVVAPDLTDSLVLRRALETELPAYMMPAEFFLLPEMKLNANGKVDLASLPLCSAEGLRRRERFVPPQTEVEQSLAPIWSEVLGIPDLGIYDDFFADLGGHSLLGTQLVSRIRSAFQIDLPLRTVFERPTISALAEAIEERLLAEIEGAERQEPERTLA